MKFWRRKILKILFFSIFKKIIKNSSNIPSISKTIQHTPMTLCMCSKYGFYLIMSEGIIDLHHILFYLYKCHEQACCHGSAWAYVMTADNHVSRRSPLMASDWRGATEVSAGRTGVGGLVADWVGQEISERTDVFCDVKGYWEFTV